LVRPPHQDDGRRDVQAIIHSRNVYTFDVTAYAAAATRERLAAVYTRVGPVQLRCLDAEAVTSIWPGTPERVASPQTGLILNWEIEFGGTGSG
jgi:hypothetical protein